MSDFWHWFIVILVMANIFGCLWLISWTTKKRVGEVAKGEVTGHKWDGNLEEFNNPMPRWWLWLFVITIVFALGYLALYPGLGSYQGRLNWTSQGLYEREMQQADEKYGPIFAAYAKQDIPTLAKDTDAMKAGQRLFINYCSTCHGSDAGGARSLPNLTDNDWLYGDTPEAIKASILNGRSGVMPGWGAVLGEEGVKQVTQHVMSLSGRLVDDAAARAGQSQYMAMCAGCHGADGQGNEFIGAANLTDDIWLHGASPGSIAKVIRDGVIGNMPPHRNFLGDDRAHLLTAYVYSLRFNK